MIIVIIKKLACVLLALGVSAAVFGCSSGEGKKTPSSGLDITITTTPSPSPEPQDEAKVQLVKITKNDVNIREEANTDCQVFTQGSNGDYFLLKEKDSPKDWNKIEYDGKDAYVSAQYCEIEEYAKTEADSLLSGGAPKDENSSSEDSASSDDTSSSDSSQEDSSQDETSDEGNSDVNAEDIRSQEDGEAR